MKVVKIAFIIIGAKIGAGFASGKEIFEYFAKFGINSLLFVIPLFFLFYFFTYICLTFGAGFSDFNLKKGNDILKLKIKYKKTNVNLLNVFMFLTFLILCSAMFSGLIALTKTYFPTISKFIVFGFVIVLSYIMINTSFKTLSSISYFIVPLIVICIIINASFTFKTYSFAMSFGNQGIVSLPILTVLYASQNTFLASFVIIKSGKGLSSKERKVISLMVASTLCALLILGILCFLFNPKLAYSNMPFAEISMSISPYFSYMFGFIIFSSIITTYATTLTSLKEFFKGDKKYNKQSIMLLLIVILSLLDFGDIIQYLYPFIGILGLIYILRMYFCLNLSSKSFFQKANKSIHKTS